MESYEELYIKNLASKKKISLQEATKYLDKCITETSNKMGLSYSVVYSTINSIEFMSMCLRGTCSKKSLEECSQSCWCVQFEGKCYPRYFEDADKMNSDPDKYVLGMPTDELSFIVKLASYLYYNYDGGGITDNTFDALEYILNKRLKIRGRRYEKIGAVPVDKIRTKLPYFMPSLDKLKPSSRELLLFINEASKKYSHSKPLSGGIWWSSKLDGVSGMAVFKDGVCTKLFTRGDGSIGGDVTYLLEYIKGIPKITDDRYKNIVVRGEFIISKEIWKEKYANSKDEKYSLDYANPRSFVSSKINSGHAPSMGVLDIEYVVYAIIDTDGEGSPIPPPEEGMRILSSLGFKVVENGVLVEPKIYDIMSLYQLKRKESEYTIDGLVLSFNTPTKQNDKERTKIAFKMRLEEQIRHSKILDVEWNISRYGRMVPVAIYESVYVDGVRMHRASAFNAGKVRDWSIGKGSKIKVIRSGDVIPTILEVYTSETSEQPKPIYPPMIVQGALGKDKGWHWNGNDIFVNDIDNNKTVQLKRSEHFFETIGVPRLREKTLEKLWDSGIRSIKAITNSKPEDFFKIKGIGKKSANSIYTSIHDVMKKTRLDRFIPASTTLNLGIGRKLIKQLLNYHPTLMEDSPDDLKIILKKKNIPGIGEKRINNIVENIDMFKKFLYSLNEEDIKYAIKHDTERIKSISSRGYNKKIRGKKFVFTGFFGKIDYELEDYIYDNFGEIVPSVSEDVKVVVSANLMNITTKMRTAERYGIKVMSIEEFIEEYSVEVNKTKKEEKEIDFTELEIED